MENIRKEILICDVCIYALQQVHFHGGEISFEYASHKIKTEISFGGKCLFNPPCFRNSIQPERSKREDKCTHILNKDAKTICFACDCEYI